MYQAMIIVMEHIRMDKYERYENFWLSKNYSKPMQIWYQHYQCCIQMLNVNCVMHSLLCVILRLSFGSLQRFFYWPVVLKMGRFMQMHYIRKRPNVLVEVYPKH